MKRLFGFCLIFASPAWSSHKPPPLYLGLKGGYQSAFDETYSYSNPQASILGVYGGLNFNSAWSWDLGYQYHNNLKAAVTLIDVETSLFESALRYRWYLQNNLSFYGRLGASYWEMEKQPYLTNDQITAGFSPLGELGIEYKLSSNLRMTSGYQYIANIGDSTTGKYDSHAILVGLTYDFGEVPQITSVPPPHFSSVVGGDISTQISTPVVNEYD
jgi:OOP family OmpA-OmpF porin